MIAILSQILDLNSIKSHVSLKFASQHCFDKSNEPAHEIMVLTT